MATSIRHSSNGLKEELLDDNEANCDPTSGEDSSFNSTQRSGLGSIGGDGTCTPLADRLCVLWYRRRADIPWLLLYGCISVAAVVVRLLAYPKDPAAWYWPGIAKGSAEAVLINSALAILAVCHRLFHRLRRVADGAPIGSLVPIQSPIEKHVAFHKITGCVALVASLVHSVAWLCIILKIRHCAETDWQASRYFHLSFLRDQAWAGLVTRLPIWTGVAMLLCAMLAAVSCLPCVRKRWYKVFATLHTLFIPFIVMLLFHGADCWLSTLQAPFWILPPLLWYANERCRRFPLASSKSQIVGYQSHLDTIVLHLSIPQAFVPAIRPGMFVFLNVPAIARLEWHPFSLTSAPEDQHLHLHVRCVGGWTRRLALLLKQHPDPQEVKVFVDGAFGSATWHYEHYDTLVFLCTGIGITPFLSILRHQLHQWRRAIKSGPACQDRKLHLVWSTREAHHFHWVLSLLSEFQDVLTHPAYVSAIDCHLHLTSQAALPMVDWALERVPPCVRVHSGRPEYSAFLASVACEGHMDTKQPIAVFVCASRPLTKAIKQHVATLNHRLEQSQEFHVFAETF